jgi:superoxide dismutase, Cu-Zn family
MHHRHSRPIVLLLLAGMLACGDRPSTARVEVVDRAGDLVGIARLTELGPGVALDLQGFRLPPGVHGIHIHAVGACDPPDFHSAGPLFTTGREPPGKPVGALPDLTVRADGSTHYRWFLHDVSLDREAADSLVAGPGTALVLHVGDREPPERFACGTIGNHLRPR